MMRKNGNLIISYLILLIAIIITLNGCGVTPQGAREKLSTLNIKYNPESFFECIDNNDIVAVELFLRAKMNPNEKMEDGTALMLAVVKNFHEVAKLLIEKGADVNAKAENGLTALVHAAGGNSYEVAKLLIENGVDVNTKIIEDATALMAAAGGNSYDVAKLLIEKGADVNAKTKEGRTALMIASNENSYDVASLLIRKRADVNAKDDDGDTALKFAQDQGHSKIVNLLKKHGERQ